MKKSLTILLAVVMIGAFALTGCNNNQAQPGGSAEPSAGPNASPNVTPSASPEPEEMSATYDNLMEAIAGETNANANYLAFAEKAEEEGYLGVARIFRIIADAEQAHADKEFEIARTMGSPVRPAAKTPAVGTTAENLQAAIDGESYESDTMYPDFAAKAQEENISDAGRIFNLAGRAEAGHAVIFRDLLDNLDSFDEAKYGGEIYRCPVCGEIMTEALDNCPVCAVSLDTFVTYAPDAA